MALPASGAISFNNVNVELGLSGTATISLNDAAVRTLFAKASGAIAMSDGYGKANEFTFSITSNQTNANLRTLALAAGWGGSSKVTATINGGVYVYSTSTGTAGLTINGAWPGGVTLVNNGYVMGMGGSGQTGQAYATPQPSGGPAISLGVNCSITNNSYIGGGGGAGGMAGVFNFFGVPPGGNGGGGGGGGAGGGAGCPTYNGTPTPSGGGAGGPAGSSGSNGARIPVPSGKTSYVCGAGGGGGRIMPGSGGTGASTVGSEGGGGGGAGGGGAVLTVNGSVNCTAGPGGSAGSAGTNTIVPGNGAGAGGGGWGASGGTNTNTPNNPGGAGGKAIALNGYTATRTGSGTTYGAVS